MHENCLRWGLVVILEFAHYLHCGSFEFIQYYDMIWYDMIYHFPTGVWGMGEWHSGAWLCGCVVWSWGQVPFPGNCSQTGRSPCQAAPACHLEVKYLFSQFYTYPAVSVTDVNRIFLDCELPVTGLLWLISSVCQSTQYVYWFCVSCIINTS